MPTVNGIIAGSAMPPTGYTNAHASVASGGGETPTFSIKAQAGPLEAQSDHNHAYRIPKIRNLK